MIAINTAAFIALYAALCLCTCMSLVWLNHVPDTKDDGYRRAKPHDYFSDPFANSFRALEEPFSHLHDFKNLRVAIGVSLSCLGVCIELYLNAVHPLLAVRQLPEYQVHGLLNVEQLEAGFRRVAV